jgi:GDSL-like Lipase/Acylhydrolase family
LNGNRFFEPWNVFRSAGKRNAHGKAVATAGETLPRRRQRTLRNLGIAYAFCLATCAGTFVANRSWANSADGSVRIHVAEYAGFAVAAAVAASLAFGLACGLLLLSDWPRLVCANLLVAGASLLVLEGATRLGGLHFPSLDRPPSDDRALWVYDARKGWFHAAGSVGQAWLGGPDAARVRINSLGLRGPEVAPSRQPDVVRVALVGDSYVFGIGVDEEHLLSTHLQELLARRLGRRVEVVNLGVSGYSTDQEYLLFDQLAERLAPQLVLLVVCDNDFRANTVDFVFERYPKPCLSIATDGMPVLPAAAVPQLTTAQHARLWLAEHSNLWNLLRTRHSEHAWVQSCLDTFHVGFEHSCSPDPLHSTAAFVRALASRSAAVGARFVVTTTGQRHARQGRFQALGRILTGAGMAYVDLTPVLEQARRLEPSRLWDFPTDEHWNDDAHLLAAETLAPMLAAQLQS